MKSLRGFTYRLTGKRCRADGSCTGLSDAPWVQLGRMLECSNANIYFNSPSPDTTDARSSPSSSPAPLVPSPQGTTPPPLKSAFNSFTLFPQLPTELRQTIWKVAALSVDPRIIPIEPDDEFEDAGRGFRCVARIGPPAVFSACSESRVEAVRIYSLKFHAQLKYPIYFDEEKDIIFMSRTSSMYSFLQSTYDFERITHDEYDRDHVRILALLVNDTEINFFGEDSLHGYPSWRQVSMAARTFANLRELRLIYRPEHEEYTPGFHREKVSLALFWNKHWLKWQRQRARVVPGVRDIVSESQINKAPDFVFWSREILEMKLPMMGRWVSENFSRRSRGNPEPLYGRNTASFFGSFSSRPVLNFRFEITLMNPEESENPVDRFRESPNQVNSRFYDQVTKENALAKSAL